MSSIKKAVSKEGVSMEVIAHQTINQLNKRGMVTNTSQVLPKRMTGQAINLQPHQTIFTTRPATFNKI
jgi:hypothetical protein